MSTVFQAFFISYLVEPGYGEKTETFQERLDSSFNYGFNAALEFTMMKMEFSDLLQFPLTRRVNCAELKSCLIRMINDGEVATLSAPIYAKYLSNEFGHQCEMNSPCSLDENVICGSAVALFSNGNPLVNQFNPYSTAFPYGNGMVLHFYQQQESSTTKTVHKVINKGLKAYV